MKDRTRNTRRERNLNENRKTRRKADRKITKPYREHRKACATCRNAPKSPDKQLTAAEIQKKRCPEGQEIVLTLMS